MTDFTGVVQAWQPGAALLGARPLTGGVSATVTALDVRLPGGGETRVVLRQYGPRDLALKPQVAREEFALLRFLHAAGLPVPAPLAHAPQWVLVGFIEGVNGQDAPPPELAAPLAAFLARLHVLAHSSTALPVSRTLGPPRPMRPNETALDGRIRAGLARQPVPPGRVAALHGDLWPGNTLWQHGTLAAVIDWEDAALGDPLADVAITRLELLTFHGVAVMDAFTAEYARLSGAHLAGLPYWDLRAALRAAGHVDEWGLSTDALLSLRERHAWFVEQALANLHRPAL